MKHIRILSILLIALNIQCNSNIDNRIAEEQIENLNSTTKVEYIPKRINKCIELFEDGQPVYYKGAYGGYEEVRRQTSEESFFLYLRLLLHNERDSEDNLEEWK